MASIAKAASALLTIRVDRKFLSTECRGNACRVVVLILNTRFFGFFFLVFNANRLFGAKF